MKSHIALLRLILEESGIRCCTSTIRDWKTITKRIEHEGISFLTISLPTFGSDTQKCLDKGKVDPSLFVGYSKSGELPRFLGGFLDRVFSRKDGRLLAHPSIEAIHCLRQICFLMEKVNLPCTLERDRKAIDRYVQCEEEVRACDRKIGSYRVLSSTITRLFGTVLSSIDSDIYNDRMIPKHGPGSTADKLLGNSKYTQRSWPDRLDRSFPFGDYLFPNWRFPSPVDFLEPGQELPVRVVTVPKTLKTPRIIAIEPTCMQYAQQALMEVIVRRIEGDDILSTFIGFSDQVPNQDMAKEGSSCGELATLDLKEASDRVSNQLVRDLFHHFPHFSEALDDCRSRKADVPGKGIIRLSKFASMGSAVCFPIEAMVFLSIILYSIETQLNRPLTSADLRGLAGKVRVYGDDIIVPVKYVRSVVLELENFGFQVNEKKSFWTGKFRESCGKEYYESEDVSIFRLRSFLPSQRRHVTEIISSISLRNQAYNAGFWKVARFLDDILRRLIPFPNVAPESQGHGRFSFLGTSSEKMDIHLQKPLVRAVVVCSQLPLDHLEGPDALLKWFLKRGEQPIADRNHLERAGRPSSVNIKTRWVSPI